MQYIKFVETSLVPRYAMGKEVPHQVNKNGSMVWMQSLCCWVLNKLNTSNDIVFTEHVVDVSNLVDVIYNQIREVGKNYHVDTRRILMGAEDFSELCSTTMVRHLITITAHSRAFGGLEITVIPWMKGILVLPE